MQLEKRVQADSTSPTRRQEVLRRQALPTLAVQSSIRAGSLSDQELQEIIDKVTDRATTEGVLEPLDPKER